MTNQNLTDYDQLVPVFNAKIGDTITQACDARALHTYLESKRQFADWIKERIEKYGFEENQDFILLSQICESKTGRGGDRCSKDYHLTLDMAKELAMVENNARGREVRRYFIRMEKIALEVVTTQPGITNLIATARAWADMTQIQANMAKTQADIAKTQADTAQMQANQARAWADEYERRSATEGGLSPVSPVSSTSPTQPTTTSQALLPPREAAFIQGWWDCLGTQSVTASDLYRAISDKQCQILNDASGALLGDISQWTAKKLSHALRRWSQLVLDGFAIFNIGKTSRGILWRLERKA